jgi:hypothetical protein
VLKKGDYVAKVITLKMPTESFGLISGSWKGDLHVTVPPGPNGPGGPMTIAVVLRFETNEHADMVAFMDIPVQKVTGVPVTEASVASGKVVIKVGGQVEYDATLSGNTMTGDWKAGPQSLPLTMTRK